MSKKIISYFPQIVALLFIAAFAVYAAVWQEPTQAPPGGNVAAPLNVGPTGQSKEGGLILNTGNATTGLIIDKGEICLGTDCIGSWSELFGAIVTYRMSVSGYQVGNNYYGSKTSSYTCPDSSTPSVTYCKSIQVYNPGGEYYIDACNCSGSTLKAYAQKNRRCESWPDTQITMVDSCDNLSTASCDTSCSLPGTCEIEFTCGKKETVGTYSSEACTTGQYINPSGGACSQSNDNAECNTRCTQAGWQRGSSANCTPNKRMQQQYTLNQCGLSLRNGDIFTDNYHLVSCGCSN